MSLKSETQCILPLVAVTVAGAIAFAPQPQPPPTAPALSSNPTGELLRDEHEPNDVLVGCGIVMNCLCCTSSQPPDTTCYCGGTESGGGKSGGSRDSCACLKLGGTLQTAVITTCYPGDFRWQQVSQGGNKIGYGEYKTCSQNQECRSLNGCGSTQPPCAGSCQWTVSGGSIARTYVPGAACR
jgi:hypothetical protein